MPVSIDGARLRKHILAAHPSLSAFAKKMGVIPQAVSNWCCERNNPSVKHLVKACALLGIAPDEIFAEHAN